jgi:hypothetical protein
MSLQGSNVSVIQRGKNNRLQVGNEVLILLISKHTTGCNHEVVGAIILSNN